jgi:hypothetical protein
MFARFLGQAAQTSRVLGPLAPKESGIRFTTAPEGVIRKLTMFDNLGMLRPARDVGVTSAHGVGPAGCWPLLPQPTKIPLTGSLFAYRWIVQLHYSGPATVIQLRLGAGVRDARLPAGTVGDFYVPVVGKGSAIELRRLSPDPAACISSLTVGLLDAGKPPPHLGH